MPRTCSICQHQQRFSIDLALGAGEALRTLAERYGTSIATLSRHAAHAHQSSVGASSEHQESTRAPALPHAVPPPPAVPEQTGDVAAHAAPPASDPVRCPLCFQSDRLEQPGCRGDFRCARCGYVFAAPRRPLQAAAVAATP